MSTPDLPVWTPAERESFFAAIERHRRAAWQVTAIATVCVGLLGFIVATLTAPLFYAVLGLALDLINLLVPMPDLIGTVMDTISTLADSPESVPPSRWAYIIVMAAVPGLLAMLAIGFTLRRIVLEAETGAFQSLTLRPPDTTVLAEQRLANVVAEMAIAANIPLPAVRILDSDVVNACVFGADERSATVLMSSGALRTFDRAQLQGVAAHLIGLIANGDVRQGMRVAQTLSLFGLVARLSDAVVDPQEWSRLAKTLREALRSGPSSADAQLILDLTNPFTSKARRRDPAQRDRQGSGKLTWRDWSLMPLYGPLVFSGFFGGLVSSVLLEPLLAMVWRRRKYMADAIAVQLTRNPQPLSDALLVMNEHADTPQQVFMPRMLGLQHDADERGHNFPAWCAHMLVTGSASGDGLLSGSSVTMYPAMEQRLKALGRMGAAVAVPERRISPVLWFVIAPVSALIAVLLCVVIYLLVIISVAFSGLFTWFPTMILHFILR